MKVSNKSVGSVVEVHAKVGETLKHSVMERTVSDSDALAGACYTEETRERGPREKNEGNPIVNWVPKLVSSKRS